MNASSARTSHPLDSAAELSYQASLVLLYFLSANLIGFQSLRSIFWASGTTGLVVASIGILQYHSLAFLGIPTNAHPSATFGNRNLAAMNLVCAIPLSGYLFVTARDRIALILSGLSASLMGVYLVYTRTRSAWLGMAGAILCVCAVVALCPHLRRPLLRAIRSMFDRRKVFLGLGFLALFSILSVLSPRQARIQDRALPTLTQDKIDITATAALVLQMDVGMRMGFRKRFRTEIGDHLVTCTHRIPPLWIWSSHSPIRSLTNRARVESHSIRGSKVL